MMAETDRSSESDARPAPGGEAEANGATELAEALDRARFVRIVARADGDALAASGLFGRALSRRSIPFQARVTRLDPSREYGSAADETTLLVGAATDAADALTIASGPATAASELAFDAAGALGVDPDPTLALAGVVATGRTLEADENERLVGSSPVERRPGVGIPTADLADGLAHTTLAHAPFSGDEMAAGAALADLADDDAKSIASMLALAALEGAPPLAAEAVSRALTPYATPRGPFATVEGFADVLDCAARERPGTALALALGHDVRVEALEAWRTHASAAHDAVRSATTGRYDGLFVARVDDAPVETAARLLRDFRSPEPIALVVSDGEAAAAARNGADVADAARSAASAVGGAGAGTAREGYARFDGDAREFVGALREALDR